MSNNGEIYLLTYLTLHVNLQTNTMQNANTKSYIFSRAYRKTHPLDNIIHD
jgi:hypothetical protein